MGREWWNEDLREMLKRKKEAYGRYLGNKCVEKLEEYKRVKVEAKRAVERAKRRVKGEWCRKVTEKFQERSKMFWKMLKRKKEAYGRYLGNKCVEKDGKRVVE